MRALLTLLFSALISISLQSSIDPLVLFKAASLGINNASLHLNHTHKGKKGDASSICSEAFSNLLNNKTLS